MSEITIKTCLLKDLPAITSQNEENGSLIANCLYITQDEPAMYIDTKDKYGTWHRLRVADFPSDLWQIDHGNFAANTDYILFDTSSDSPQGHSTLKKGKLPSILTGEALNKLFEVAFPIATSTPVVGLWTGTNINQSQTTLQTTYACAAIDINTNEIKLIQLNSPNYEFFIDKDEIFNTIDSDSKKHLHWSYLSDIICNIANPPKTVVIYIKKTNNETFKQSDCAIVQSYLKVSLAQNTTEMFVSQINNRIAALENKLEATRKSPFEFTVVSSTTDMVDVSKIYILQNI